VQEGKQIKQIEKLIESSLSFAEKGLINKSTLPLKKIYSMCLSNPFFAWNDSETLLDISKTFTIAYHFDIFDSEKDNITITELAYLYAYRAYLLETQKNSDTDLLFAILKQLCIILQNNGESILPKLSEYFSTTKLNNQNKTLDIKLAEKILPILVYVFIIEIEDTFHSFRDDDFIEQTCNNIELDFKELDDNLFEKSKILSQKLFIDIRQGLEQL